MPSWPTVVSTRPRSLDKCPAPVDHVFRIGLTAPYVAAGGIEDPKAPLFQSVDRAGRLTGRPRRAGYEQAPGGGRGAAG